MVPAPLIVVVDANVLFPFTLRDTVLRAATAGFYQLRWSAEILDEHDGRRQGRTAARDDGAAAGKKPARRSRSIVLILLQIR
jgi:hypothetical protein